MCRLFGLPPLLADAAPPTTLASITTLKSDAHLSANLIFNPTTHSQPNPYALTSLNEAAVEATFGKEGMNLESTLIRYIKNFYFFLEYCTRIECAARLVGLARTHGMDAVSVVEKGSWQGLINELLTKNKATDWQALENILFTTSTPLDWSTLRSTLQASSWQALPTTSFWKEMPITQETITRSTCWQRFLKYTVAHTFTYDQNMLATITDTEENMFGYLPNLEVAFYDESFLQLRNGSEMLHLQLLLNQKERARLLPLISDWKFSIQKLSTALYPLVQSFYTTPYYKALVFGADATKTYNSISQNKSPITLLDAQQDPALIDHLIAAAMVKNLHALVHFLTDTKHLKNTITVLQKTTIAKPIPAFWMYDSSDSAYLLDKAHLHESFIDAAQQPLKVSVTPAQSSVARTQFSLGGLWDDAKSAAHSTLNVAQAIGQAALGQVEEAGEAMAQQAKDLGFGSASHFIISLGKDVAEKILKESSILKDKIGKEVKEAQEDVHSVVNSAIDYSLNGVSIAKDAADKAAGWAGGIITDGCNIGHSAVSNAIGVSVNDNQYCEAAGKTFETLADLGINVLAQEATESIVVVGGAIRLSVDAVSTIATAAADIATGHFSSLGSDLVSGLKTMAEDAAASVLQAVSFELQFIMQQLVSVFQLISYLIALIVRSFIDIVTADTFMFSGLMQLVGAPINANDWANAVNQTLSAHQATIGAVITTGLLLATIPLTGGASTPIAIMGAAAILGPQLFGIYGSYQQDELTIQQKEDEKEFVAKYQTYVNNNKLIYENQQDSFAAEFRAKYNAEISNQERGLGFAVNRMANNFESIKNQTALLLGSYWNNLLSPLTDPPLSPLNPDFNAADVGSLYGFTTHLLDLNPAQGFSLYSAARNSFSQEIAAAPALANANANEPSLKNKNWFNQMQVYASPVTLGEVHARFRAIKLLTSFNIGLYYGTDLGLSSLKKNATIPLDTAHLAKMLVFTKDAQATQASLKIYEHEGKGWIDTLPTLSFKTGTWYHMKLMLNGSTLQTKVWDEANAEPTEWQTTDVTLLDPAGVATEGGAAPTFIPKTVGFISSGAAVEYQFIEPLLQPQALTALRPPDKYCALPCLPNTPLSPLGLEKEREKEAQQQFTFLEAPTLSKNLILKAAHSIELLKENYVYTTEQKNTGSGEYGVLAQWHNDGISTSMIPGSLGQSPAQLSVQNETTFISLASQKVYRCDTKNTAKDGQQVDRYCTNATQNYIKQRPSLSKDLVNAITQQRAAYLKEMQNVNFGIFKLPAASAQDLDENRYIYSMVLQKPDGTPLTDTGGKPLLDFMLFTPLRNNFIDGGKVGLDPEMVLSLKTTTVTPGLVSLVSGNLFAYDKKTSINSNAVRVSTQLQNYERSYGTLTKEVSAMLKASQTAYQKSMNPPVAPEGPANTTQGTTPIKGEDVTQKTTATTPSQLPEPPPLAPASLQQLSEDAGDDSSFG